MRAHKENLFATTREQGQEVALMASAQPLSAKLVKMVEENQQRLQESNAMLAQQVQRQEASFKEKEEAW